MKTLYIGIDTGKKTGVTVWCQREKKVILCKQFPIHQAILYIRLIKDQISIIAVEDARKRVWLGNDRKKVEAKKKGAGSIERDAIIWEDFLKDEGIEHRMQAPILRGTYKASKKDMSKYNLFYRRFPEAPKTLIGEDHKRDSYHICIALKDIFTRVAKK